MPNSAGAVAKRITAEVIAEVSEAAAAVGFHIYAASLDKVERLISDALTTFAAQQVQATWEEAAVLGCEDCRHGVGLRQREDGMWQHAVAVYDKGEKQEEGWLGPSDCHKFLRRAQEWKG